jgi:hypothetical protein
VLGTIKEHIKQGFQWGAREGPLCDERRLFPHSKVPGHTYSFYGSNAECEVPNTGREYRTRTHFPGGWTNRADSSSGLLFIVPDGECHCS